MKLKLQPEATLLKHKGEREKMRILLTNDDGFRSPGILLLAAALREAGHRVFVVAPDRDRSGISHSISFINGPCKLTEVEQDTWVCEGDPADCIAVSLLGGVPELCLETGPETPPDASPPDLVISGINRGANLGTDIIYSGTAAAARQGALAGIPSLALSLVEGAVWNWDMAVIFVMENLEEMAAGWKSDSFINVNIPNQHDFPSGMIHTFPSLRYYNDRIDVYHAPDGCRYCFIRAGEISPFRGAPLSKGGAVPQGIGEKSDWEAVEKNFASLSRIYVHPVLLESVKLQGE
jgi:5'-nucleotidase